jgi:hypothetical protein
MFLLGKPPVKVNTEVLHVLEELCVVYMYGGGGARYSLCGECDVEECGAVSFGSSF